MGKFKNVEEFAAAYEQYYKTHPDAPVAQDIECLDPLLSG